MSAGQLYTTKSYRELMDDVENEFRLWKIGAYTIPTHTVAKNAGDDVRIVIVKDGKETPISCTRFSGEHKGAERNLCALRDVINTLRKMDQRGIVGVMAQVVQTMFSLPDPHNAYHIIGAEPDATDEQLNEAYRKRRRQMHPDTPGGSRVEWDRLEQAARELGLN